MAGFRPVGPKRASTVAKVRRTATEAYGTKTEWAALSAACIRRDGNRCTRCPATSTPGNRLNAHHKIPVSRGGKSVLWNLVTLCQRCHSLQPFHGHMRIQMQNKALGRTKPKTKPKSSILAMRKKATR